MRVLRLAGPAGILLLSACSTVTAPLPALPPLPAAYPQASGSAPAADPGTVAAPPTGANDTILPATRWWESLHDPVLDQLISLAQTQNHDVRIALARVAQARAVVPASDSRSAPQLNLGGDLADSRSSLPAPVKFGLPDTTAIQLNATLSWELDLMGAAAAGSAAARAQLASSQWGVRGAQMMVANEVARVYLQLLSLERSETLSQAIVSTYDLTAQLLTARLREGSASQLDMERLLSARAAAQSQLPSFAAERAALFDRLALLLGVAPGAQLPLLPPSPPAPFDPFEPQVLLQPGQGLLGDPGSPPVGQPADLLLRRPDLQAAAGQLSAELARQRQAHAERYPRFFLSALFGGERLTLNSIPYSPARYSNAALAFSAPLLDGGRLAALEALQGARAGEAALVWQQSVLRAVEEVDASLARLKGERARQLALQESRDRALAALMRMRALQREGESDALGVLERVRDTFLAQAAVLDAERDRGLALIQLYAALGGGWPDSLPETPR